MLDEFPKLGALPFLENALGEMAGYGISAHLICQSFNDVFKHYGAHTSIFDNCHVTAAFATSEPDSIERIVKRAGRSLEMRESFSDPRLLFGTGHRSRNQAEVERYILAEQDVRALPGDKQFLFVNNAKPFLADKIRYFDEPMFAARTRDSSMASGRGSSRLARRSTRRARRRSIGLGSWRSSPTPRLCNRS